jgi:hypothetical protein
MASINSGLILRVLPRTAFDFTNIQNGNFSFPLVQKIASGSFTEATWMIRLHALNIAGAGASINFVSVLEGYDFGDPGTIFFQSGPQLVINNTNSAPFYNVLAAQPGTGRLMRLDLNVIQAAAAVTCTATISVDLALKGGDGSAYVMAANEFGGYGVQ